MGTLIVALLLLAAVLLLSVDGRRAPASMKDLADPTTRSLVVLSVKLDVLLWLVRTIVRYERRRAELLARQDEQIRRG